MYSRKRIVMTLLATFGLVEPKTFRKQRPIALVLACIVAALLTPPDVISQILLAIPMAILYEGGLIVSRMMIRSRS